MNDTGDRGITIIVCKQGFLVQMCHQASTRGVIHNYACETVEKVLKTVEELIVECQKIDTDHEA